MNSQSPALPLRHIGEGASADAHSSIPAHEVGDAMHVHHHDPET